MLVSFARDERERLDERDLVSGRGGLSDRLVARVVGLTDNRDDDLGSVLRGDEVEVEGQEHLGADSTAVLLDDVVVGVHELGEHDDLVLHQVRANLLEHVVHREELVAAHRLRCGAVLLKALDVFHDALKRRVDLRGCCSCHYLFSFVLMSILTLLARSTTLVITSVA